MWDHLKDQWRQLRRGKPGHRFQDRYHRRKESGGQKGGAHRWLAILAGVGLTLVGIFMLAAPGPGLLVMVAGLALLGSEYLFIARFLDWAEVRLRKLMGLARRAWRRCGMPARAALVAVAVVLVGGLAYGGYAILVN